MKKAKKSIKKMDIDSEFENIIREKMTDTEFWKLVSNYKDCDDVIDEMKSWDESDKKEVIDEFYKNHPKMKSNKKTKKIASHDYKCDRCGKKATLNLQSAWHLYDIDTDGNFNEQDSWEGDTNEFYCEKCYKKYN